MESGLEFGELREEAPSPGERPDRNSRFAVFPWGVPQPDELPVFIALDVFRDIESHAQWDTGVELGGVLLGGQHVDPQGRPFVTITAALPAEHYENSRGSFKFTHQSWEEISRQRSHLPAELKMVGWYHTHPDWGVFLSSPDRFICEHFFGKLLDVAYVVDPCRGERGMFHWSRESPRTLQANDGFYVFASRFRQQELVEVLFALRGEQTMSEHRGYARAPAGGYGPAVLGLSPQAPWVPLLVLSAILFQAGLFLLLVWHTLRPEQVPGGDRDRLAAVMERWESTQEVERRAAAVAAQQELLERIASQWEGSPAGLVQSLSDSQQKIEELQGHLVAHQARARELEQHELAARQREAESQRTVAELRRELDQLRSELANLQDVQRELQAARTTRPDAPGANVAPGRESAVPALQDWRWWGAGGALLALAGGLFAFYRNRPEPSQLYARASSRPPPPEDDSD